MCAHRGVPVEVSAQLAGCGWLLPPCVSEGEPDHQAWPQVLLHSSLTTKSKILRGTFNKTSLL